MDPFIKFFWGFTGLLWLSLAVAIVDLALGNGEALTGVIGAGLTAPVSTWAAWVFTVTDRSERE